jgi:hypothetical protein
MSRMTVINLTLASVFLLAAASSFAAETFGAAMPEGEARPLAAALADPSSIGEPARKFSGRVVDVCQNKGCWMMLEQDGVAARVMVHEHSFELPRDASGQAIVYGVLSEKELTENAAAHLADDSASKQPVARREYRINAYSVSLDGA